MRHLSLFPNIIKEEEEKKNVPIEFFNLFDIYKEIVLDDMSMGIPKIRRI
jgi:hypothetical protein